MRSMMMLNCAGQKQLPDVHKGIPLGTLFGTNTQWEQ